MTIVQIVDLMAENGYDIARTGVEYGIQKLRETQDVDVDYFIDTAIRECSTETVV
jgi:hypothetical protein|tara:strand:- start:107 stop:271 length:165 start_codon:yes stop_codon:yes gene_type:complete